MAPKSGGEKVAAPQNRPGLFASMGLAATTALIAVNFTHPIEVVKTRMQVGNFNFGQMVETEGVRGFYKGIQAAYGREASYTSPIRNAIGAGDANAPFYLKFSAGALSGSLGSVIGNPFDVLKTMGMANTGEKVPTAELAKRLYEEQGIGGFYRGVSANVARACVLNGTKMAVYDWIKGIVKTKTGWNRKDPRSQFVSAGVAGFFMACTVSPFDMLRTRLMNQPTDRKIYTGFLDAFSKILRSEGPLAFWRGFFPIWGRFAPQATLQLVIMDRLLTLTGFDPI